MENKIFELDIYKTKQQEALRFIETHYENTGNSNLLDFYVKIVKNWDFFKEYLKLRTLLILFTYYKFNKADVPFLSKESINKTVNSLIEHTIVDNEWPISMKNLNLENLMFKLLLDEEKWLQDVFDDIEYLVSYFANKIRLVITTGIVSSQEERQKMTNIVEEEFFKQLNIVKQDIEKVLTKNFIQFIKSKN